MRWARFAVFVLVATVLQANPVDIVSFGNIKPDLLLILVVFFAIYCDTTEAIITSFIIGFASDLIGSSMGPGIISLGVLGTLLAYLHEVIAIRQIPYQGAAIFVLGLCAGVMTHFLGVLRSPPSIPNAYWIIFGTAVYSAIVGPFLFQPCAWCMNIKKRKR